MTKIKMEDYNKAIQDINNQNFSDYCKTYFDRVQLSFDNDWTVYYNNKGEMELHYCDENVYFTKNVPVLLGKSQSEKVYDFLKEKELQHEF